MKIALAQMNIVQGKISQNLEVMKSWIEKAKSQQAEMIVFPAFCLTGIQVDNKELDRSLLKKVQEAESELLKCSQGITVIYGSIKEEQKKFKNQFVCSRDCQIQKWEETKIQIASLDDDINEEAAMVVYPVFKDWSWDQPSAREQLIKKQSKKLLILVNGCGIQSEGKSIRLVDGGSSIINNGQFIGGCADDFKESLLILDTDQPQTVKITESKLLNGLLCAVKEVDRQWFGGNIKWIIGLSGGLDSTINAALLAMALDPKRVIGYNMATRYNSLSTKDNARNLANDLGIEIREGSIEKLVQATINTIQDYQYTEEYGSLVYENIQARLRGHLLSTFASIEKGVIVNNGNKVEVALGYCTLYGDAIGAFAPIGDCTKVQLFELASEINQRLGKEVIPANLLPEVTESSIEWLMPPSAELKDAQKDPMKWFYHDWLTEMLCSGKMESIENLMEAWLDGSLFNQAPGRWLKYYGLDNGKAFIEDLEWFTSTMQRNAFKHQVIPPIVKISHHDFNEILIKEKSSNYEALKQKIILKGQYGN